MLGIVLAFGAFPVEVHGPSATPSLQAARFSLPGLAAAVPTSTANGTLSGAPTPLTVVAPRVDQVRMLSGDEVSNQTSAAISGITTSQEASALPTGIVESSGSGGAERIPIFFEYEVQPGDTLSSIAARFGVGTRYITWNNVDILDDENSLPVGITLQIPSVEGIVHSVRVGETVSEIAIRYDANVTDIVDFRANGFGGDPNNVREGQLILVPGGRIVPPPTPAPVPAAPSQAPGGVPGPGPGGWVYPSDSRLITSPFGPFHPLGVDWGMPIGSPVYASNGGQVVFVGGNPCCSYGYHIIIEHDGGYETLYAHLNDFNVANGEWVNAGQVIGWSGNTGRSTGPHLHFELRRNGVHQDPMGFLP
jgi:murein DD-endopeptidase MepM/ murein hydrolase activator NlpD